MYVHPMHTWCLWSQKRGSDPTKLGIQMVWGCHADAGNRTQEE